MALTGVRFGWAQVLTHYGLQNISPWAMLGYECIMLGVVITLLWAALAKITYSKR